MMLIPILAAVIAGNPSFEKAEQLFADHHFSQALSFYEQANEINPIELQTSRDHWGYCLLFDSTNRYNELIGRSQPVRYSTWANLESDVRLARRLAPRLGEHAGKALAAITVDGKVGSRVLAALCEEDEISDARAVFLGD